MDYHQVLKIAGGVLALLLFVPMIVDVLKAGGEGHSFATWLLWAALDTTAAVSVIAQRGNYLIVAGFAVGGILMTLALLYRGRFGWSKFDNVILLLVLACLFVWWSSGAKMATIAATVGILIAGLPAMWELRKTPDRKIGNLWAGYALANAVAFFGGTAMTVEERFAPGVFAVQSLMLFAISRRPMRVQKAACEVEKVD